jgi:hypothetical protein
MKRSVSAVLVLLALTGSQLMLGQTTAEGNEARK